MGDRANVIVKMGKEQVVLYTHWSGTELPLTLQAALRRAPDRWQDPSYLTRIIFSEMVAGQERETTGFGIWPSVGDGTDRILLLDLGQGTVTMNGGLAVTLKEYLDLKPEQLTWD